MTLVSAGCDGRGPEGGPADGGDGGNPPLAGLFTSTVAEVALEVDYQPGAEPYTGLNPGSGNTDTWDLFKSNAEALFAGSPKTLLVPNRIQDMEQLADVTGTSFTVDAILSIATAHWTSPSTETRRVFYVLFLEGSFNQDGADQTAVLGVSLGDTGIIAMFKPVIRSTGLEATSIPRLVEQVVMIHEFGHAVGLVNNGVPLSSAHQDTTHGAHCSNADCAMYYTVDGYNEIVDFINRRVQGAGTVLFGSECLEDTRAASGM
jgi:hypothetical protein